MSAIHWRGVLLGGLFLAAQATTVAAQERERLSLDDALRRADVVTGPDQAAPNPRIAGPQAQADALVPDRLPGILPDRQRRLRHGPDDRTDLRGGAR